MKNLVNMTANGKMNFAKCSRLVQNTAFTGTTKYSEINAEVFLYSHFIKLKEKLLVIFFNVSQKK